MSGACTFSAIQPAPVWLPAMRAGELDGRYIDTGPDLGPTGDGIPVGAVSVAISRQDGNQMTSNDLALAGNAWPISVDPTGLIVTIGFLAPTTSAGVVYQLTLTVNLTVQGRLFIRDLLMTISPVMG